MTLVKNEQRYIDQEKPSKTDKKGVMVISEMPSSRIIFYLMRKHNSGLKSFVIFLLAGYIAYDKVVKYFV